MTVLYGILGLLSGGEFVKKTTSLLLIMKLRLPRFLRSVLVNVVSSCQSTCSTMSSNFAFPSGVVLFSLLTIGSEIAQAWEPEADYVYLLTVNGEYGAVSAPTSGAGAGNTVINFETAGNINGDLNWEGHDIVLTTGSWESGDESVTFESSTTSSPVFNNLPANASLTTNGKDWTMELYARITANSIWLRNGRWTVHDVEQLDTDTMYLKGGHLWLADSDTALAANLFLGITDYWEWNTPGNTAIRFQNGAHISGEVTFVEDVQLNVHEGGSTGTISGLVTTNGYALTQTGSGLIRMNQVADRMASVTVNGNVEVGIIGDGSGDILGTVTLNNGATFTYGSNDSSASERSITTIAVAEDGTGVFESLGLDDSWTVSELAGTNATLSLVGASSSFLIQSSSLTGTLGIGANVTLANEINLDMVNVEFLAGGNLIASLESDTFAIANTVVGGVSHLTVQSANAAGIIDLGSYNLTEGTLMVVWEGEREDLTVRAEGENEAILSSLYLQADGVMYQANSYQDGIVGFSETGTSLLTNDSVSGDLAYYREGDSVVLSRADGYRISSLLLLGDANEATDEAIVLNGTELSVDSVNFSLDGTYAIRDGDNAGSLEIGVLSMQGTGTLVVDTTASIDSVNGLGTLNIEQAVAISQLNGEMSLTLAGTATILGDSSIGSLTMVGGGVQLGTIENGTASLTLAGGIDLQADGAIVVTNGSTVTMDSMRLSTAHVLTLGDDEGSVGVINVNRYVGSDDGGASSVLNINAGVVLNILGDADGSADSGAFVLGHWSADTSVNVAGTLNLLSAHISSVSATYEQAVLHVQDGGVLNIKGLDLTYRRDGGDVGASVVLHEGGVINIGEDGIGKTTDKASVFMVTLNGGALGILDTESDAWTGVKDMAIGGEVTINSALYTPDTTGQGSGYNGYLGGGGTITLTGALTASVENANLIATGSGTVIFQNNLSGYSGILTAAGGTMDLNNSALAAGARLVMAGGTASHVSLGSGVTLGAASVSGMGSLNGVTLSGSATLALYDLYDTATGTFVGTFDLAGSDVTVSWNDSDMLTLDFGEYSLGLNQSVTLFSNAGSGSFDDWDTLWSNGQVLITNGNIDEYSLSWENGALVLTRTMQSIEVNLAGDVAWTADAIGSQTDVRDGAHVNFGEFADGVSVASVTLEDDVVANIVVNVGQGNTVNFVSDEAGQLTDGEILGESFQSSVVVQSGRVVVEGVNSYSGGTTLSAQNGVAAELEILDVNALGSGAINFYGGRLIYGMDQEKCTQMNAISVKNGSDILVDTGNNEVVWASAVEFGTDSGISKSGSGILTLSAASLPSHVSVTNGVLCITDLGQSAQISRVTVGDLAAGTSGRLELGDGMSLHAGSVYLTLGLDQTGIGTNLVTSSAIGTTVGADLWQVGLSDAVVDSINEQLEALVDDTLTLKLDVADGFEEGTVLSIDNIYRNNAPGLRFIMEGYDAATGDITLSVGLASDFITTLDASLDSSGRYYVSGYESLKYEDPDTGRRASDSVTLDADLAIQLSGASNVSGIDSLVINQLQSSGDVPHSLYINNSNENEAAVVTLNNDEGANTIVSGSITASNGLELSKTGSGKLTVEGGISGSGIVLTVDEGVLRVNSLDVKTLGGRGTLEVSGEIVLASDSLAGGVYEGTMATVDKGRLTLNLETENIELGSLVVGAGTVVDVLMNVAGSTTANNSLTLAGESVIMGSLQVTLNTTGGLPEPVVNVAQGGSLSFANGSKLVLSAASGQNYIATSEYPLTLVLADNVSAGGQGAPTIEYGNLFRKYYDAATSRVDLNGNGELVLTAFFNPKGFYSNTSINSGLGEVGVVGGTLLDHALTTQNPQYANPDSILSQVMNQVDHLLDNTSTSYNPTEASRLMASGMPYYNMWIEATGSHSELDQDGELSGYEIDTWGGTFGVDVDLTEKLTVGMAMTANYGDLNATASESAEGDLDSYYVNLFGRYQSGKWAHTLVLTSSWNEASLTRRVNYGTGSFETNGDTSGVGWGAMYEVTRDINLNEEGSTILQPLFNLSVTSTSMDGYEENGTGGNAGLRVDEQELTTGTAALGARVLGLFGQNVFGRDVLGELRVNVAQDFGDNQSEAGVGFVGVPGFQRTVRGAESGETAIQVGAGLHMPVGDQGTLFINGNGDFRDGSTSYSGSIGYRYNF